MPEFPKLRVSVGAEAFFALALLLLLLPLRWTTGFLIAALVHEAGHLTAVRLCGGTISSIRIGFPGAEITAENLSCLQELLCTLAGPICGLLLTLAGHWLPEAAICAGIQSIYNLLPVYPLDGGRALRCLIRMTVPGAAGERLCSHLNKGFLILLSALVLVFAVIMKLRLVWLGGIGWLLLSRKIKIPCKPERKRLQ